MKNKYYTPEIEEFHVGFEYERCDDGYNWIKDTYPRAAEHIRLKNLIPCTRVKYLDREDIESLGFVCHATDERVFHNKNGIIINTEWGSPVKQGITLAIVSPVFDESKRNIIQEHYLFNGTIKNKSELKKLLKQLGI